MLVLALVMVPLLIVSFAVHHLSRGAANLIDALDYFIWAMFLMEYLVKISLAPKRWLFVRKNIPDLVVIGVPFLRPLRIVRSIRAIRVLRLARLTAFPGEGVSGTKRTLHSRSAHYVLVVTAILVALTSVMVLELERGVRGSNIKTFGDAIWWAITTVTTVGYGDRFPVSPGARAIAAVLMIAGVALFGILTAAVAAFFVQHGREGERDGTDAVAARLDELLLRLAAIEMRLAPSHVTNGNENGTRITTSEGVAYGDRAHADGNSH